MQSNFQFDIINLKNNQSNYLKLYFFFINYIISYKYI